MRIEPAPFFRGRFTLPGDKSISHRAAILGAMAEGATLIRNYSSAADCASTLSCLRGLGVGVTRQEEGVTIEGRGLEAWRPPSAVLDAENSGSTIRMLAGALAGRPFRSVLTGDESLRRRPVERVAVPLRSMGATVVTTDGRPPVTIDGGRLRGVAYDLPVASAQVKTAVLLAGLQAEGRTTVREPTPSRDHTERMLPAFGVRVERDGLAATVEGGSRLRGTEVAVPGDASSAAFLVVAALVLPDSEVRLDDVLLSPTRTAFLDVLRAMGGRVEARLESTDPEPVGSIVAFSSSLTGTTVDPNLVPSLIDEVPALAAAAAFARGEFTVLGASELRVKESDRIAALAEGLAALGARVRELPDGLVVEGGAPLRGARVRAHGDHRIAMALSVAALAAEGATEVEGADCVAVSFPGFYTLLERARA
ncbi:MAG TPA: 3-phosphoshikimate 1-carboxyvinyltransferase [Vicinamibacteria bacterium]|nr:3-phosphoshikimate 1-carboxyvinyltransferase [Vicinamibacteria bacterium]